MNAAPTWLAAPWVEPLGLTLLHFLWQGAVLGALAWLALRLAHKRSAKVRYLIAGLLMLTLAVLPVVTFLVLSKAPPSTTPAPMLFVTSGLPDNMPDTTETTSVPVALPMQALPMPKLVTATPSMTLKQTEKLAAWWMVPFWLAGVLCMAARLGFGWLRIQRWQRSATPTLDAILLASFQRLTKKFGLGARVRLLISKKIPGPVTYGWIRPAVLLPAQMLTGLPAELLEALLAHELAHIARRDFLANLVQSAIEVVLFYHPAVWWLGARVREIREECCDELAVQACGDRLTYARALESLAELQLAAEPAAAASGGNLLARITRIVGRAPEAAGSSAMGTLLFLIVAGGLLAFWSVSSIKAQDQAPAASQNNKANLNTASNSDYSQPKKPKMVEVQATYANALPDIVHTDAVTGEKVGTGPAHPVSWSPNPRALLVPPPIDSAMLFVKKAPAELEQSKVDVSSLKIYSGPFPWNYGGSFTGTSAVQIKAPVKKSDPVDDVIVNGEVKQPLIIPIDPATPLLLSQLIVQAGWTEWSNHMVELLRHDKDGQKTTEDHDVDDVLVRGDTSKDVVLQPGDQIYVKHNWQTMPPTPAPSGGKVKAGNAQTSSTPDPTKPVVWNGNFTFAGASGLNTGTGAMAQLAQISSTQIAVPPSGLTYTLTVGGAFSGTTIFTSGTNTYTASGNLVLHTNTAGSATNTITIGTGSLHFSGTAMKRPMPDSLKVLTSDALTGEKLTVPSFDAEWNGNSSANSTTVPLTANAMVENVQKLARPTATQGSTLTLSGSNSLRVSSGSLTNIPPVPDPTVREDETIQVPTKLNVERGAFGLVVVADKKSAEPAQISVGKNMTLEILTEVRVSHAGAEYYERSGIAGVRGLKAPFSVAQACNLVQWMNSDTVAGWSKDQPFDVEFEYCLIEAPHLVPTPFRENNTMGIDEILKENQVARVLWRKTFSVSVDDNSVGPEITYGADAQKYLPAPQKQATPPATPGNPPPSTSTEGKTTEANSSMPVQNPANSLSAIAPNQVQIQAYFIEYRSSLKFEPSGGSYMLNYYLDQLKQNPDASVITAPKITVLLGKEAAIQVGQPGAKLSGTDYSGHTLGVGVTLQCERNGDDIEFSGKESLATMEKIEGGAPDNIVQHTDLTEMVLHGKTAADQINVFQLGEGKPPGRSRAIVLIFNNIPIKQSGQVGGIAPTQKPTNSALLTPMANPNNIRADNIGDDPTLTYEQSNDTTIPAASRLFRIEVEAYFVEYPNFVKFEPPMDGNSAGTYKSFFYLDQFSKTPDTQVLKFPVVTVLGEKQLTINIGRRSAKLDGTDYSTQPNGISLAIKCTRDGNDIEYSAKETVATVEDTVKTANSVVQHTELTEMIIRSKSANGQIKFFNPGTDLKTGRKRVTALVLNIISPATASPADLHPKTSIDSPSRPQMIINDAMKLANQTQELPRATVIGPAGEYKFTFANGEKVPVTLGKPSVYVSAE